jgi:hypothetical protein
MPAISAISIPKFQKLKKEIFEINNVLKEDNIPRWADGTFTGKWGLREYSLIFGMVEFEIGNISGFYGKFIGSIKIFKGKFYPAWNESKIINISGIYAYSVLFGQIGDIDIESNEYDIETNETSYVGIGSQNITDYNWRIMSKTGPTFYIKGVFSKFD